MTLSWEQGQQELTDFDLIANRPSAKDGIRYEIEPGCSYVHVLPVIVPDATILMARVTFWWRDDKDAVNSIDVVETSVP